VGVFANWWLQMKGSLQSLITVIPQINSEMSNRSRTINVGDRWNKAKDHCQSYSNTVHPILQMDCFNEFTSNLFADKGKSIVYPPTGKCPNEETKGKEQTIGVRTSTGGGETFGCGGETFESSVAKGYG
jgi:hypothetical protein